MLYRRCALWGLAAAVSLASAGSVWAHPGHAGHESDFHAGWQHPLMGLDHLLAIVAVGLLAARMGGRTLWLLPGVFLGSMFLGGVAASAGLRLPGVEFGILTSVLVLGALVAAARVAPQRVAVALVTLFAFFHGHAHAAEMLTSGSFAPYAAGFLLTTAALLATSLAGGLALEKLSRTRAVRFAGGAIAAAGLLMFAGLI